jgi:hypoxanthine phosphoribosyltransferase
VPDLPSHVADDVQDILITSEQIQKRLGEIAADIDRDYADTDGLLVVGVLKGAYMVIADLTRHLTIPTSVDFMACSSYGSATKSSGTVRILKDLDADIENRDVLIVEDIIDSGLTLDYLLRNLQSRHPRSLEVMSLLAKPERRRVSFPIRYVGFEVPDVFVVGYGLDYDEDYRGLDCIATLKPEVVRAL